MHPGGRVVVGAIALALSAACGAATDDAQVTTTTTAPTTTTTVAPTTTTAKPAARKATTTTAPPAPEQALPMSSDDEEEVEIVVRPEDVYPYLFSSPGENWTSQPYEQSRAGPVDLDKAAADEVDEGEDPAEARKFLEEIGFMAGYTAAWNRTTKFDTSMAAQLYFFASPEGARAYLDYEVEGFKEATNPEEFERIDLTEIPGVRAWTRRRGDGPFTPIMFTRQNFYARIVVYGTQDEYGNARTWATNAATAQYHKLEV